MLSKESMLKYLDNLYFVRACPIRIHGNGFIQIDVDTYSRLHIWSNSFPKQKVWTGIHDHRFSFFSTCIFGDGILNKNYFENNDDQLSGPQPDYKVYVAKPRKGEDTELVFSGVVIPGYKLWVVKLPVPMGRSYSLPSGYLHETLLEFPEALAVTHMTKYDIKSLTEPRVLCPVDREPDNSFDRHRWSDEEVWEMAKTAVRNYNR